MARLQSDIGITGVALQWVKSYLTQRTQEVHVQGMSSKVFTLRYGVPQGSVLGPIFFTIYAGPISSIAQQHGMEVHGYADDTQLYVTFVAKSVPDAELAKTKAEACVADLGRWMTKNKLKLNNDKTELLVIASKHMRKHILTDEMQIGEANIQSKAVARNLGVMLDQSMNMEKQVTSICQSAYGHLRNIRSIRPMLTHQASEKLVHAFVTSRLDNANSLLYGVPNRMLVKLQKVQNAAARVITKTPFRDHITPVRKKLHWLPIYQRIQYKILYLTWRCLHGLAPIYLKGLLEPYNPVRHLRSETQHLLTVPRTNLRTYGDRSFSYAAPILWNSLPLNLRQCDNLDSYKKMLKSHLFQQAYQ